MKRIAEALLTIEVGMLLSGCASINPVPLTPFADGMNWMVERPIVYEAGNTEVRVVVPDGFVTDFASVPRALWPIYPKTGPYQFPAVVHDYLYWEQSTTREEADQIFLEGMRESMVGEKDRQIIYKAVQAGGSKLWKRNQDEKKEGLPRIVPMPYRRIPANTTWKDYRAFLHKQGVRP